MTGPVESRTALLAEWREHLARIRRRSPHTVRAYLAVARRLLDGCGLDNRAAVSRLTAANLRRHLAARRTEGIGNASAARELSAIKAFVTFAMDGERGEAKGIGRVRGPRLKKGIPRPVTPDDALALADDVAAHASEDWIGLRDRAILLLLYGAGLRIAEALSLTGKNAALPATVTVTGKGGKQRVVPILPVVREAVAAYVAACPYPVTAGGSLFRGAKGGALNQGMVQKAVAKARHGLGLPSSATPHALRHSFASHLLAEGADLRSLQELLGHASLGSTQIYTRVDAATMLDTFRAAHPRERDP